jgi:hypothetical protein
LAPLIFDVFSDGVFVNPSGRLHKVSVRPETVSPKKFFQFRKFLPKNPGRPAFQEHRRLGQRIFRRELQEKMQMIRHDFNFMDEPLVHLATLKKQFSDSLDNLPSQDPAAIFRHEYEMRCDAVKRMSASPKEYFIYFRHILAYTVILYHRGIKNQRSQANLALRPAPVVAGLRGELYPTAWKAGDLSAAY